MEGVLRQAGGQVESIVMPGLTHFTASLAGGEKHGYAMVADIEETRIWPP